MLADKVERSITYGSIVYEEMITWFNHTMDDDSSFFIQKHEVGDLVNYINDLKDKIIKLQKELDNGKTNS